MTQTKIQNDDIGKTGTLIALGNTLLAPLWWADSKLGLTAAVLGTGAFLYVAHEEGKKRRPLGNAMNSANSFFSGFTGDKSTSVSNAAANIAAGGGALFDEVTSPLT